MEGEIMTQPQHDTEIVADDPAAAAPVDYHRKVLERRLRSLLGSPIGNRCVECGHVKHNDLGYCQTGDCSCDSGCTVKGLATIILRDLDQVIRPAGGDSDGS